MCGGIVIGGFYFGVSRVKGAAERMQSQNNLKQLSLGVINYESTNSYYPGEVYGRDGKLLASWRVHLLPYIEADNVYRQWNINEPWDSATNRPLLNQMSYVYASPADKKKGAATQTYYRGFTNPGAFFGRPAAQPKDNAFGNQPGRGLTTQEIKDAQFDTILALEAGDAIEWSRPGDLDASAGKPFPSLGGARDDSDIVLVVFVDGQVKAIRKTTPESRWRAGVTVAGNDVAGLEQ
jgi:hypothetical protein